MDSDGSPVRAEGGERCSGWSGWSPNELELILSDPPVELFEAHGTDAASSKDRREAGAGMGMGTTHGEVPPGGVTSSSSGRSVGKPIAGPSTSDGVPVTLRRIDSQARPTTDTERSASATRPMTACSILVRSAILLSCSSIRISSLRCSALVTSGSPPTASARPGRGRSLSRAVGNCASSAL